MLTITRYHDISCGHRVVGHESKCRWLHGHNYRVHFTCAAEELDKLGRVVDFGFVKTTLCQWLEDNWDHKLLLWEQDPMVRVLTHHAGADPDPQERMIAAQSVVAVSFNPTAENMAQYLLHVIGPVLLERLSKALGGLRLELTKVVIEETRKCSAAAER